MKFRSRTSLIIIALALLILVLAVFIQQQSFEIPTREIQASRNTSDSSISSEPRSALGDAQVVGPRESNEESVSSDKEREARGSGYVWGNALNGVYTARTLNGDGQWRLDITELYNSFKGVVRPVHLEDATASPQTRAEYLAAVITGALGLNTAEQPALAGLLQDYYKADPGEGTQKEGQRTRLSAQAREALLAHLPPESKELFQDVFSTPDFLFRSMFIAADEIKYATGGTSNLVAVASGKARLTIGRDGRAEINSEETRVQKSDSGSEVQKQNP
ncbi:hypothetical protein ACXR0O_23180 [Verrucomicrobiota bacterium sgz303538]